jgi:tetratricopeptide (TPR) repeat protein/O-antigen ligase
LAVLRIRHAMEAVWLAGLVLIPITIAPQGFMVAYVQIPKIAMLRADALLLLGLWAWEWALTTRSAVRAEQRDVFSLLLHPPARWVVLAAGAILATTLLSTLLSPVPRVSLWGVNPGWDGYSFINLLTHLAIFLVVATHLRTWTQPRRILWAVAGAATIASIVGISQHFGFDPLRPETANGRTSLTFGNPIFAGSFLVMAIPLTLALVMSWQTRLRPLPHILLGAAPITLQSMALIFTSSRGPWIGLMVGLVVFLAVLARLYKREQVMRATAIVIISVAVAVFSTMLPSDAPRVTVTERLGSIVESPTTGLSGRWGIWTNSVRIVATVPWPDTEEFVNLPSLSWPILRPLIGFGPDVFPYVFPLDSTSQRTTELGSHGHNFAIHAAVETGLLGAAAYSALYGALGLTVLFLLRRVRRGEYPDVLSLAIVGLAGAMSGRFVEQLVGKGQVSDLLLFWTLAAALVALASRPSGQMAELSPETPVSKPRARSRRRGRGGGRAGQGPELAKIGVALVASITIAAFWFQNDPPNLIAAKIAQFSANALEERDYSLAVGEIDLAIDLVPYSPVFHLHKGGILEQERLTLSSQVALLESDTAQRLQEITDPVKREAIATQAQAQIDQWNRRQVDLFRIAYDEAKLALEWNAMDHRALSQAGQYSRELGAVDPTVRAEAIMINRTLVELLPAYWQAQDALAWAYVLTGQPELALAPLDRALKINSGSTNGSLAYYIRGVALNDLGRTQEAIEALEQSMELTPTLVADLLLRQLRVASSASDEP